MWMGGSSESPASSTRPNSGACFCDNQGPNSGDSPWAETNVQIVGHPDLGVLLCQQRKDSEWLATNHVPNRWPAGPLFGGKGGSLGEVSAVR